MIREREVCEERSNYAARRSVWCEPVRAWRRQRLRARSQQSPSAPGTTRTATGTHTRIAINRSSAYHSHHVQQGLRNGTVSVRLSVPFARSSSMRRQHGARQQMRAVPRFRRTRIDASGQLPDEERARDSDVLVCNFAKYSPIVIFFTDKITCNIPIEKGLVRCKSLS